MNNLFGLAEEYAVMTRQQVAEALRISPARVFQIENRAPQKIRRAMRSRGLELSDFIDVMRRGKHDQRVDWLAR